MFSQYFDSNNKNIIRHDIDKYFTDTKDYLNCQGIQYASYSKSILVNGIYIELRGKEEEPKNGNPNQNHRLIINLSTQNFEKSFNLLKELVLKTGICDEWMGMKFYFNKHYSCLHNEASISSIISDNEDVFRYVKGRIGIYSFTDNFKFWIDNANKWDSRETALYFIGVSFKVAEVDAEDIAVLFGEMQRCQLIFEISQ